jgi:hypothetical protein
MPYLGAALLLNAKIEFSMLIGLGATFSFTSPLIFNFHVFMPHAICSPFAPGRSMHENKREMEKDERQHRRSGDDYCRLLLRTLDEPNISETGFNILDGFFADLKQALRPESVDAQETTDAYRVGQSLAVRHRPPRR